MALALPRALDQPGRQHGRLGALLLLVRRSKEDGGGERGGEQTTHQRGRSPRVRRRRTDYERLHQPHLGHQDAPPLHRRISDLLLPRTQRRDRADNAGRGMARVVSRAGSLHVWRHARRHPIHGL